jgi:flagellar basal body rod protein FlgG
MIKDSKNKFTLSKRAIWSIILAVGVPLFLWFVITITTAGLGEDTSGSGGAEQGTATNAGTQFTGDGSGRGDPEAQRMYCEDSKLRKQQLGVGGSIRDMCVLDVVAEKYLPTLTDEQVADLLENQPTCFETGYDDEGYHCFTGFDESGCDRSGLDDNGNACKRINQPAANPLSIDKATMCGMLEDCDNEAKFDETGFNKYGCNRQGRKEDGTLCPAEFITPIYDDEGRDQLGFTREGFNSFGCDRQGLRADGTACPLSEVTRVFNRNNRDQFGFDPDGYNAKGCNLEGQRADGSVCAIEDITRVYDPETGRDQLGFDEEGYNEKQCNAAGFKRDGTRCELKDITRIVGKDGRDQFGLFSSGLNEHNCDIEGYKPDGSLCPVDQSPRLFSPLTGEDQFGLFPNKRNKFGCDEAGFKRDGTLCSPEQRSTRVDKNTGLSINGLSVDGYNSKNCNLQGFTRSGQRCALEDIPRLLTDGFDQFGIGSDGYNKANCNAEGFDREGKRCALEDIPRLIDPNTKLDQFGLDLEGYNVSGCDLQGRKRDGSLCNPEDVTRLIDPVTGLDQFGLDAAGFSPKTGCNLLGFRADGSRCSYEDTPKITDADGFNQLGLSEEGRNRYDCDINGRKPNGELCASHELTGFYDSDGYNLHNKNKAGFDRLSFNDMGYNEFGCDINGLKANGKVCDADELTHVFAPGAKYDQFGLDREGYNSAGCNLKGLDRQGKACDVANIPRIFGRDMVDQLGTHVSDVPVAVWSAQADALERVTKGGQPLFVDGKAAFVGKDGYLVDAQGNPILDENGERIRMSAAGELVNESGEILSPARLTDAKGRVLSGALGKTTGLASKVSPLSKGGEALFVDGKQAFMDKNGYLVDAQGNPILDENGERIKMNANGELVNESGQKIDASRLTNANGKQLAGKISVDNALPGVGAPLLKGGEALFVDGKQAFVGKGGYLVDAQGNPILDENGERIKMNAAGELVNESGQAIDASRLTNAQGKTLSGPLSVKATGVEASPLLKGGKIVHIDGKAAFVGDDGYLVDAQGNPILDADGQKLRLNELGQVVNESGRVLQEAAFTDDQGNPLTGALGKGRPMTESEIENKLMADGLTAELKQRLGLDDAGFNAAGCGLNGLRADGSLCEPGSIPRLYDADTGLDQFGFGQDGYNEYGCDFYGKNRQGELCAPEHITRVVGKDGYDQFGEDAAGFLRSGLNRSGENALGCDVAGNNCSKKQTPKLRDSAGVDQFHERSDGRDRLGLKNGFNDKGCGLDGLNRRGEHCAQEDIPRLTLNDNKDQFGLVDGYNEHGCGLDGLRRDGSRCPRDKTPLVFNAENFDQFGFDPEGFNKNGCDLNGIRRDGSACELADTTRLFNPKTGLDQLGLDNEGFNSAGCNLQGVDREGNVCAAEDIPRRYSLTTNLDQFGLDPEGYNAKGCDLAGRKRDGSLCDINDVTRIMGKDGRDQFGFDDTMRNEYGCDFYGYDPQGKLCEQSRITRIPDADGKDQFGVGIDSGVNEHGCNLNDRTQDGDICPPKFQVKFKKKGGKDRFGMVGGKNAKGCDLNGLKADGTRCEQEDVTRVVDPETGRDQFGLDGALRNVHGCDVDGLDRQGNPCRQDQLTHLYDANDTDQFGLLKDGYSEAGCNLLGLNKEGQPCARENIVSIRGSNGLNQLGLDRQNLDEDGFDLRGLNIDGCDENNRKADGTACEKYASLDLEASDALYIEERKQAMRDWLNAQTTATQPTPIGEGTYVAEQDPLFSQPESVAVTPIVDNSGLEIKEEEATIENGGQNGVVEIPLGLMARVRIDTPINSDYMDGRSVYATFMGGELDGARLRGNISVPYINDNVMPRDKFSYVFDTIIYNRKEYPITATSINVTNDSGMVDADDVDYHRFQRYGGLLVATAMQAAQATFLDNQVESDLEKQASMIEAAQQQVLMYGENSREIGKENAKIATKHAVDIAQEQFNRRPTLTKGRSMQLIIFTSSVENDELPVMYDGNY